MECAQPAGATPAASTSAASTATATPINPGPVEPVICPEVVQKGEAFIPLAPLFGANLQGTEIQTSRWIELRLGSTLDLTLHVTNLVGTLAVYLETCNEIDKCGMAVDSPRVLGAFEQTPGAPLPSKARMHGQTTCDMFVRVTARPGAGQGQSATWRITGRAITSAFAAKT
jgi:hypothetical protein